ncbi:MAG: ABC transporter ATP-binding protein, partial [Pseudohongiellaceae bacterium]
MKQSVLIGAEKLTWLADGQAIINNLSLHLAPGELLGVVGPNGAGKSSLLKLLAAIHLPDSGNLQLLERPYASFTLTEFARTLAYLEQNPLIHWPLPVRKIIALGRLPHQGYFRLLNDADHGAIDAAIAATGISHLLDRQVNKLSAGEKLLVALSRLLATEPEIILADEPVASLDPYHQLLIMDLLSDWIASGKLGGAIVVLHDLTLAARYCSRIALLNQGSIVAEGTPEQVFSESNLSTYYHISARVHFETRDSCVIPLHRQDL